MQTLQQELWALEGPLVKTHIGDLAWWLTRPQGKLGLWLDGDRCVAWAWLHPPATLDYEVHPDYRESALPGDMLAWLGQEGEGNVLTTYAFESDGDGIAFLQAKGYERPSPSRWYAFHLCELDEAEQVDLPEGFQFRTVDSEEDFRKRVALHQAVWAPSRLTEESYRRITHTWPYRADLDCFAEARDGRFASYVLCWYDDANRVGLFEPVGTHPDFRRMGLGAAVCRYALGRLREAGATRALVLAAAEPAVALYESVGFRRYARLVEFSKER